MKEKRLRKWVSKKRALAYSLLGRATGFFVQYDYMDSVTPPDEYPAIRDLCERADLAPIFDQMRAHDTALSDDFFLTSDSRHLGPLDGAINYCIVRHLNPAKIVEIGSGRSTQILARAINDNQSGGKITCIDPAPRLDITGLPISFEKRVLSAEDTQLAMSLERDDILYVDSSHILFPGTDVDIEFNMMFPALKSGVVVHVHDIFLPWGYSAKWSARNWNEVSGLIPWIASGAFEILFPSYYAAQERWSDIAFAMPKFIARNAQRDPGGIWLRKR
jgi:hypothetical protein